MRLPTGYYFEWGGQFENMTRARRHLMIIVPITIGAIFFLLFLLFRLTSIRRADHYRCCLRLNRRDCCAVLQRRISLGSRIGGLHCVWGIAVLNGVVLVSYIRSLRESGKRSARRLSRGRACVSVPS